MKDYRIEGITKDEKQPIVILLHGVGSNKDDLWPLLDFFKDRAIRLSIQGDIDYGNGHAYFLPDPMGNTSKETILTGEERLYHRIMKILSEYDLVGRRIYLFGFSQGAMLSQVLLTNHPTLFDGAIISHSRYLDFLDKNADLSGKSVMILQGKQDPLFPPPHGQKTTQYFEMHQAHVTFESYDVGHGLSQKALQNIILWLDENL